MNSYDRFEAKYIPEPMSGCWLWTAALSNKGYGFYFSDGHNFAHRWSYSHFVGPIPEGLIVRHRCDTPSCVNPDHLELGTQSDNMQDCIKRGRHKGAAWQRRNATHCKRGHEYTEENTLLEQGKYRVCRACKRERYHTRYATKVRK